MTFRSEFKGNEHDRSGMATFTVGTIERQIHFERFEDYHAICGLLNAAHRIGRAAGANEIAAAVRHIVGEMA